jgi:hypothetical protein
VLATYGARKPLRHIAAAGSSIQKGDEILVGVTPDNLYAEWVWESDNKPINMFAGEGSAVCTVAQGADYMPGVDSLEFRQNYFDCARVPYESGGEDQPLGFSISHDYRPIRDGDYGPSPDAKVEVTVFELNVGAMVKDANGNEVELPEEEDAESITASARAVVPHA